MIKTDDSVEPVHADWTKPSAEKRGRMKMQITCRCNCLAVLYDSVFSFENSLFMLSYIMQQEMKKPE